MSEQTSIPWWLERAHADLDRKRERDRTNPRALARERLSARVQREREEERANAFARAPVRPANAPLPIYDPWWAGQEADYWNVLPGAYGTFVDSIADQVAYFVVSAVPSGQRLRGAVVTLRDADQMQVWRCVVPPLEVRRVRPDMRGEMTRGETEEALQAIAHWGHKTGRELWKAAGFVRIGFVANRAKFTKTNVCPICWYRLRTKETIEVGIGPVCLRRLERSVDCPTCGVVAGQACGNPDGTQRVTNHAARSVAYMEFEIDAPSGGATA